MFCFFSLPHARAKGKTHAQSGGGGGGNGWMGVEGRPRRQRTRAPTARRPAARREGGSPAALSCLIFFELVFLIVWGQGGESREAKEDRGGGLPPSSLTAHRPPPPHAHAPGAAFCRARKGPAPPSVPRLSPLARKRGKGKEKRGKGGGKRRGRFDRSDHQPRRRPRRPVLPSLALVIFVAMGMKKYKTNCGGS